MVAVAAIPRAKVPATIWLVLYEGHLVVVLPATAPSIQDKMQMWLNPCGSYLKMLMFALE